MELVNEFRVPGVVAVPLAKRALPVAGGLAAGIVIGWLLGRRSA